MTEEFCVPDVQTYHQSLHSLGSMYLQLMSAEVHLFPNFFQSRGEAFGNLLVPSSCLDKSISTVSSLKDSFRIRSKVWEGHALIVVDMTPVKRETYLSPCGIIEKRSEKDTRVSENPTIFSFAFPNPPSLLLSQSCIVFFMIDRRLSTLGGPIAFGSSSLDSGYLVWNFSQISANSFRSLKSNCKSSFPEESLLDYLLAHGIHAWPR